MFNKKGSFRLSAMFSALVFVGIVVGFVFFLSPLRTADTPPSFNPGATLFQGKLVADDLRYYYVSEEKSLAEVMECLNVTSNLGFVYYDEGFQVYQIADAGVSAVVVDDPADFEILPGRVFGLTVVGNVDSKCVSYVSNVSPVDLSVVTAGLEGKWVQVVSDSPEFREAIAPLMTKIDEVWIQEEVGSFRKIDLSNFEQETFSGYYAMWLKFR